MERRNGYVEGKENNSGDEIYMPRYTVAMNLRSIWIGAT
jgi:hypothetical protein